MDIKNIFEGDGINEALQVSLLAEFSKNCGLINSATLDNIVSDKVKNLSSNYGYVYNTAPVDYKLYNSQPSSVFKESISNLIYDTFFKLLSSDTAFVVALLPTLINYQKGILTSEDLRMIILDNLSDDIEGIISRLENGENLTAEEISNIVSEKLKAKKGDINTEGVKLASTKKTSQDGLSNYTPFSSLALSQRYKGIRWRAIKGTSLSPKTLERLQRASKNVKTALEKTKGALRTARQIVNLLKSLESIVSNGYVAIFKSLSKIIFSYVRDIGSTGVYVLNMIEPYASLEPFMSPTKAEDLKIYGGMPADKIERIKLHEIMSKNNIISSYDYINSDLRLSNPAVSDYTPDEFEPSEVETAKKVTDWINSIYKPTTYASFIRTIANAFLDEGDIPGDSFLNNWGQQNLATRFNFDVTGTSKRTPNAFNTKNGINLDFLRPGRPRFGNGSNSVVVIVAFSMPNFLNLATASVTMVQMFWDMMMFLTKGSTDTWDAMKKSYHSQELTSWVFANSKFGKRWARLWGKTFKSTSLLDFYQDKPYVDEDGDVMVPTDISEDPDFYGMSVRSIFPSFFESMDVLERQIDKYVKNFKSSLSKEIDNLLKMIEEAIDDLEDFIDKIDAIISFFELLKTMGLSVLSITSNGGNEDIVEKLLAAENFPGVEEGDPLRLIGGMVFCYGTPNLQPNEIDFQGIIKQQMTMVNYEAALAKYESGGKDSDDDPGTLQEYITAQGGIGIDYNSALDKIFKKLF
jgi:hypothetical protein